MIYPYLLSPTAGQHLTYLGRKPHQISCQIWILQWYSKYIPWLLPNLSPWLDPNEWSPKPSKVKFLKVQKPKFSEKCQKSGWLQYLVLFPRRFTLIRLGIIKLVYSFCSNQNNMYNLSFMHFNAIPVSKSSQNFMT